jgi:protein FrlC
MKLSVASSVFVNYPLRDAIRMAANAGYAGIDIWGGRPHVYRRDFPEAELSKLKKLMQAESLEPASFMPAFFRYPHSLSSPNEVVRQDSLNYMYQCMDNAVVMGAKILLVVPGHSLYGQDQGDARKRMVDSIAAVCEYSQQYGIALGIEPANRAVTDLVNTASDALKIIQELGYKNLGIVLDTGHIHLSAESPEEAISISGTALLQVHVNDNDGRRQQNLIPGEGSFDFENFLGALGKANFNGFSTVELGWDYTLDPVPAVREAEVRISQIFDNIRKKAT